MVEIPPQREQTPAPERSAEELYVDSLKLKRDLLSSHYAMNSLRRNIDERLDEIPEDKLSEDQEVREYESVKREYDRRKELFLGSLGQLSEGDNQKVSALTSLTKIEVALSTLGQKVSPEPVTQQETITQPPAQPEAERPERETSLEEAQRMLQVSRNRQHKIEEAYWEAKVAELQEREKAEKDDKRREDIKKLIQEIENTLAEKYRVLHQEVSVIDRRPLEEEIKKLEEEKSRLEKEVESPEGKVGKSWGERIRSVFRRRKSEIETTPSTVETPAEPSAPREVSAETPEVKGSKQLTVLSWLAERGKGILSAGIWEVRQAWRFQRGTKFAANDMEALSSLINIENADEAKEKADEMLRMMRENRITTVTAPEFIDIARKVTYEKATENNDRIEYIIKNSIDQLKERVAKYRGQATAETVLTPENLKAVEDDLRLQLNKFRDGATMNDVESFAKVMRDNMDKRWWLRYIYAPLEASLIGYLGYNYLPWSRWFGSGDLVPGGEDVTLSPEDAGQRWMDHNIWEESKEDLHGLGVDNPTHQEIQDVASKAAQENNIRVVSPDTHQTLWPETAGGQIKDISMLKGLIKWGAAHKVALGIKAARLGLKVTTGF